MKKTLYLSFILTLGLLQKAKAQLSFAPAVNYSVGTNPGSIISADFNGDGKLDLAVANGTTNDVSILMGSGTGTFSPAISFSVGSYPRSIISGDFNGDLNIDLAVANQNSNDVSILLGTGTGSFAAAVSYSAGAGAKGVTSADFNGDSFADLAVANNTAGNVSILLGSGTGSFGAPVNYTTGSTPWTVTNADFNGDGKTDLAVVNGGSNNVSILFGSGTGTFSPAVNYGVSTNPRGIIAKDFNVDGKLDLAVSNLSFNDVSILLGSGTGTFSAAVNYTVGGTFPVSITSGDYDLDGFLDLATSNSSSANASILRGSGIGTFSAVATYSASTNPSSAASADFNGDGKIDLAIANLGANSVSILINTSIPLAPNSNFLISDPKCIGTTINFTDKSTYYPTSWTWSFPGGTPSSSTIQNPVVTYSASGTYSAVLTTVNGYGSSSPQTQTFVINANPSASASNSGILTCLTTTVGLSGSGGGTYSWTGPGIISGNTTANPIVNQPGCYTLSVNDANGCKASAITCVGQNTTAPVTNTNVSGTLNCTLTSVNASATTTTSPVTYNWTGTGITSATNISTITVNASGVKNYTVTNISNGCVTIGSLNVSQNLLTPSPSASSSGTITCLSNTVQLSCTPASGVTYTWSAPAGSSISSGMNSQSANGFGPGTYSVIVQLNSSGCTNSSTVTVSQNTIAPSGVSAGVNQTITCASPSVSLNGSVSTPTNPSVNWTGPYICGSVSSLTTSACSAGAYTLTVSNPVNGCTSSSTVNVITDLTAPSITIMPSSSIICAGETTTMTASGAISYTWLPGGQTTSSITASPVSSTNYTITGTGANGCTNSTNQTITVNSLPTIFVNGTLNICKGASTTLLASGATTYTWDTGINTSSISVTPTITTIFSVNGEDSNGCINTATTSVNIISSKNISGVITSTAGATSGDIILYKYTSGLRMWDSITTVPISSNYLFTNIDSALYVIRAIPTATNIQVTYADSAISWQNATIINHGCVNNTTQNVKLVGLTNIGSGSGFMSGTIVEALGFGLRMNNSNKPTVPGNPIGGIVVKGGRNPGGEMFTQTTTDPTTGTYTLVGLPDNNVGVDEYFILVDIPGLDTNLTYHRVLTSGNNQLTGLDFTVDSMYINPIANYVGINDLNVIEHQLIIYPNPTAQFININYELKNASTVNIDMIDILGRPVKVLIDKTLQVADSYKQQFSVSDLNSGVYFIKLKIDNTESVIKLVITN